MASKTRNYFWQVWRPKSSFDQVTEVVDNYYKERQSLAQSQDEGISHSDVGKAKSISLSTILHNLRSTVMQVYSFIRRGNFQSNDWNLTQVQNAVQTESMFRRAIEKYVEQIWKNGFEFIGQNPQTVRYIRQRFSQIAQVTGKTTIQLFQEMGFSIAAFAQVYVILQRNIAASGGKKYVTYDGKERIPIAGLRVADPETMWVEKDEFGNARRWKQQMSAQIYGTSIKAPEWPAYNVVHIQDRTATSPKYFFAMPMVIPVLADIKALRETEELALLQAIKFAISKFHAKVGEKDKPGTGPEVDSLITLLNSLPSDGVLVTTNRVEVENISSGDGRLDMGPLKAYWRDRIQAGLGMSDVAMGKGDSSSRATAQVLSIEMQSTTIKFQQIIKSAVEEHIIKQLLYEVGYRPETIKDNMVYLRIPEIDLEQKIKREAHVLQKWTTNTITQDELRKELGYDIMTSSQQKELYLYMVQIPLAEAEAKAQGDAAIKKSLANKNNPTNQHGRSTVKPRINKDEYDGLQKEITNSSIDTAEKALKTIDDSNLDDLVKTKIKSHLSFAFASDGAGTLPISYISNIIFDTLTNYFTIE